MSSKPVIMRIETGNMVIVKEKQDFPDQEMVAANPEAECLICLLPSDPLSGVPFVGFINAYVWLVEGCVLDAPSIRGLEQSLFSQTAQVANTLGIEYVNRSIPVQVARGQKILEPRKSETFYPVESLDPTNYAFYVRKDESETRLGIVKNVSDDFWSGCEVIDLDTKEEVTVGPESCRFLPATDCAQGLVVFEAVEEIVPFGTALYSDDICEITRLSMVPRSGKATLKVQLESKHFPLSNTQTLDLLKTINKYFKSLYDHQGMSTDEIELAMEKLNWRPVKDYRPLSLYQIQQILSSLTEHEKIVCDPFVEF